MQIKLVRALPSLLIAGVLAACSRSASVPGQLPNQPLVPAFLHTATLVAPDGALADALQPSGYTPMAFPSNYPAATRVEAALWDVPESVAAQARLFAAPAGKGPNLRVLVMSASTGPTADPRVERDFYRNVLGTGVPQLPAAAKIPGVRVRAWTFIIEDASKARDRLRDAGIEVTLDPVRFSSPYLGDHWTMGVRAPGGVIVELVQGSAR
jgi:hypothetical protein